MTSWGRRGATHATEADRYEPGLAAVHVAMYHEFVAGGHPAHPSEHPGLPEAVADVLDETTQQTLPAAPTCGPAPEQYKGTIQAIWPASSGRRWADHP